jgi:hypothetical protein
MRPGLAESDLSIVRLRRAGASVSLNRRELCGRLRQFNVLGWKAGASFDSILQLSKEPAPVFTLKADSRRNQLLLGAVFWAAYLAANNIVNALSVLTERSRMGLPVDTWEPFVWELSSGIFLLLLIPLVGEIVRRFPISPASWKGVAWVHLLATLPFCALHILGMVALRQAAYGFAGRSYDFGDVPTEFLYEWRKDAITYLLIVTVLQVWRWRQVQVAVRQAATPAGAHNCFEVKSKGRLLTVSAEAIDWIEAAGNYVILHTASGQHMVRETLKAVLAELDPGLFLRVHRSAVINTRRLDRIDAMARQALMLNGDSVPVSRGQWTELAARLSVRNGPAVPP